MRFELRSDGWHFSETRGDDQVTRYWCAACGSAPEAGDDVWSYLNDMPTAYRTHRSA